MAERTKRIPQGKIDAVQHAKDLLGSAENHVFADFRGLNVGQMTDLRERLRENESVFKVVKNTIVRRAFQELGLPEAPELLIGPTAIASSAKDPNGVAKILSDFARDSKLVVKGGLIAGRSLSPENVESLSKLPPREQLLAMFLGTLNAPVRNLAFALNGLILKLVWALKAVADEKQEQ